MPSDTRGRLPGRFLLGCLLVVAGGCVLSLGVFAIRGASEATTAQYIFWRALGFTAAMWVVAALGGSGRSPFKQLQQMSGFGLAGALAMAVSAGTFITAVRVSTFAETFFICSLAPLVSAALAWPLLRERIGPWTGVAIALAVAGVYVMVGGAIEGGNWTGRLLAIASCLAFAIYTLSTRGASERDLDAMLIAFGTVTIIGAAAVLLVRLEPLVPARPIEAAFALAHGALILSLGLWLYGQGSRHVSAVTLTMLAQTEAVASPLVAYLFFDETPTTGVVIGGAIILAAVVVQALDGRNRAGA